MTNMDKFKHKNDEMPIRLYKPSGWMQFGLGLMIIFVVVHFSIIMRIGLESGWFMLIFLPVYAFILWMLVISSNQQYLAIYEDGIEHRMGSTISFSRWEDLERFEIRPQGKSTIIGIYTTAIEKRHEGSSIERFLLGGYKDLIPLSVVSVPSRWDGCWTGSVVDTAKFANTELGSDLLHYAPQLFEYGKEKNKNE